MIDLDRLRLNFLLLFWRDLEITMKWIWE